MCAFLTRLTTCVFQYYFPCGPFRSLPLTTHTTIFVLFLYILPCNNSPRCLSPSSTSSRSSTAIISIQPAVLTGMLMNLRIVIYYKLKTLFSPLHSGSSVLNAFPPHITRFSPSFLLKKTRVLRYRLFPSLPSTERQENLSKLEKFCVSQQSFAQVNIL